MYRVRVLMTILQSDVVLAKIKCFGDLLEENALALTSVSNLRQLLRFVLTQEIARIKEAISGRPISIMFDGMTHVCKAMLMVVRYLKQDVCQLMLLTKSMTGEEVARQIVSTISRNFT